MSIELSKRERRVLQLICDGLNYAQAGAAMGITRGAIGNTITRIYVKSGCTSCAHLGVWAVRNGVVDIEPRGAAE